MSGKQKVLPLRWCDISSVYTSLSTALLLLFKCLSINWIQQAFSVSGTVIVVWSDSSTQPTNSREQQSVSSAYFFLLQAPGVWDTQLWIMCTAQHSAHTHTHTLSGHRGDSCRVGAASITVDIVCHHYNGMGFKNMPAREKNKSSRQSRWRKLV